LFVILRDDQASVAWHEPPDDAVFLGMGRIGRKKEGDESVLGPVGEAGRESVMGTLREPFEFGRRFVSERAASALFQSDEETGLQFGPTRHLRPGDRFPEERRKELPSSGSLSPIDRDTLKSQLGNHLLEEVLDAADFNCFNLPHIDFSNFARVLKFFGEY